MTLPTTDLSLETQETPDEVTIDTARFKIIDPSLETIEKATKLFFKSFHNNSDATQSAVAFLEQGVSLLSTCDIHKAYLYFDPAVDNYRNLMSHEDLLSIVKKEWLLIKLKTHYSKKCLFFVMSGLS